MRLSGRMVLPYYSNLSFIYLHHEQVNIPLVSRLYDSSEDIHSGLRRVILRLSSFIAGTPTGNIHCSASSLATPVQMLLRLFFVFLFFVLVGGGGPFCGVNMVYSKTRELPPITVQQPCSTTVISPGALRCRIIEERRRSVAGLCSGVRKYRNVLASCCQQHT